MSEYGCGEYGEFGLFFDLNITLVQEHLHLCFRVLDEHQMHGALLIDHLEQVVPLLLNETDGDDAAILIDHLAFHAIGSVTRT